VKRLLLPLATLTVVGCASTGSAAPAASPTPASQASAPAQAGAPQAGAPSRASGLRPFAELTRDATERSGFFDTYEKGDALYMAVPKEWLDRDFLLTFQIAQGIGAGGLFGGTMLNIFEGSVVAFEQHGERLFLVQKPVRFTAPEGSPAARAVELSFSSSVLESAKVESVRGDSARIINIYDWVVSDLSDIGSRVRGAGVSGPQTGPPPPANFDRGRSHLETVKSFPDNVNVRAKLTFRPAQPRNINSVPDSRFIPVSIFYSFARLPAVPMEPRLADDRVGYFMTVRKDFGNDDDTFFVRYVNRWRLEPGVCSEGLCEPVKPIVYYLDHNIPEEYRPYMIAGVEAWNRAFEAAGWRNAVRAEMLPEGADAEDIRYATLRWNTSDQVGYGAIGPSIVDPRTGEILDADMLYEANMIRGFKRDWRTTVTPTAAIEEIFNVSQEELEAASLGIKSASLGAELSAQGALLRALLAARGDIGPGDEVPMAYVGEAIKWVTMHEVGHTLGLRHNFRSSADTPLERLHDREWARERGVFSSVMEYPAVNLSAAGEPNGYYYTPGVGTYDQWAIAYGYTPTAARAADIARLSARPGHAYGTDEDARGPGALDPDVNVYDLGSDPLVWGRQRARLISGLWADLPRHVLNDNTRYADLTDAFQTLLVQYSRALTVGPKYIGGQYQHRDRVGDPDGRGPFVNVPRARQREALAFLNEYAFGERAFAVPPALLQQLGANRWSHWGESNTYNGRIDYPFHEQVLGVQRSLLEQLTNPLVFARIRDAEMKYGAGAVLPIPELMQELTQATWSEVWAGSRNVAAMRRDLQRAYLDRMTDVVVPAQGSMPADARAVARMQLTDLDRRLARALAAGGVDAYTRAHLTESRDRISKVLEAGLEVERRTGR
jgi:hypothetical protein